MSGKISTSCYSFDRKNLCSEIRGNKQRSSVDGGGGGGNVGKLITINVFLEKKNGISLLSKNDFYFMYLF